MLTKAQFVEAIGEFLFSDDDIDENMTPEEINQELLDYGWSQERIDQATADILEAVREAFERVERNAKNV